MMRDLKAAIWERYRYHTEDLWPHETAVKRTAEDVNRPERFVKSVLAKSA